MTRRKKEKIVALRTFENVFEDPEHKLMKGKWNAGYFENDNPLVLELGCGKGEYTIALAGKYPQKNFIGIDIKGPRLWKGAKDALDNNLFNTAFIRMPIELLPDCFAPEEVSEIWITFPDPYPKESKAGKRLISPRFLNLYKQIVKHHSTLHFKTDNEALFNYALEVLNNEAHDILGYTYDLYHSEMLNEITSIKTTYEKKFLAEEKSIKYLRFKFR